MRQALHSNQVAKYADMFSAMGTEPRLRIMRVLLAAHPQGMIAGDIGAELDIPVNVEERGGLSDGNLIWDAAPTLDGLGPWGDNEHCSERNVDGSKLPEYVEVSSFVPKAALNTAAILKLIEPFTTVRLENLFSSTTPPGRPCPPGAPCR